MKDRYVRRADFDDMQWTQRLGILRTERAEYAETPDEIAALDGEIARLEAVIKERTPKPAVPTQENAWQFPKP